MGPRARHGHHATLPRLRARRRRQGADVHRAGASAATEAAELGLVTRVADDPLAAAQELAAEIAGRSPDARPRGQAALRRELARARSTRRSLLETELQVALLGSPNQIAAVTAGMTKQPGEFEDPAPAPVA